MKPIELKRIAERFTSKYYPQWISRFDRIWNMLDKIDLNKIRLESSLSDNKLGGAFGIAGATDPQLNECISGIAILAFTYQNVKDDDNINEKDIKNQISIVPVSPKITADLQNKIGDVLSEMLASTVEEAVKPKNEIIFSESQLLGLHKKASSKTYPIILLENIILQKRIHWLWGFVFLSDWQYGERLSNHPKIQFGNYISKEVKKFQNNGFSFDHKRGGDEWWIDYETSKAKCNLLDSRGLYEQAKIEYEKGHVDKSINKLKLAISPFNYETVKFIDAYSLLITCIFKVNYKEIPEDLLGKVKNYLLWYKRRLRNALFIIETVYIKNNILSVVDIEDELSHLENELKISLNNIDAINAKVPITEDEKAFDQLVYLICNLKEGLREIIQYNPGKKEMLSEAPDFNNLKKNKLIKELFHENVSSLQSLKPYILDKEETENFLLLEIISSTIDFDKYNDASFKIFLKNKLEDIINEMKSKQA